MCLSLRYFLYQFVFTPYHALNIKPAFNQTYIFVKDVSMKVCGKFYENISLNEGTTGNCKMKKWATTYAQNRGVQNICYAPV